MAGIGPGTTASWITFLRGDEERLLADPAGAVFGIGPRAAELVNRPGSWDLSTLRTPDPRAAERFYGARFGWRAEPYGAILLWRLPGYVGGLPEQPVPRDTFAVMEPGEPAGWRVDFRVHDADASASLAGELGGRVLEAPHDVPGFRTALLADPQGGRFSITQFR